MSATPSVRIRSSAAMLMLLLLAAPTPTSGAQAAQRTDEGQKCASRGTGAAEDAPFGQFSYSLFRAIAGRSPTDNVIISPVSAASALAVAFAGAKGATASAMGRVLGVGEGESQLLGERTRSWRRSMLEQDCVQLTIANALWADANVPFDGNFVAHSRDVHDALVRSLELKHAAEEINAWAREQTHGRIQNVVHDPIDETLLLLNAVYFKGLWASPFDSLQTGPGPFYLASGDSVTVPRMKRRISVRYGRQAGFQLARLPYLGVRFGMYVLLPDTGIAPADLVRQMEPSTIDLWLAAVRPAELNLVLPRLKLTTKTLLIPPLSELGMQIAFDSDSADFSGMVEPAWLGGERVFLSRATQDVFIEINEEGTEAAAVTSIGAFVTSVPPPPIEFTVDRPFLLIIRDDETGAVLFIGQIFNPLPT